MFNTSKNIKILISLGLIAAVISACYYDSLPEPEISSFCEDDEFVYDEKIKPIIEQYCSFSTCHDGVSDAPGNFKSYNGMKPYLRKNGFEFYIISLRNDPENGMPPDLDNPGPNDLSAQDFEILKCWILKGYPEK